MTTARHSSSRANFVHTYQYVHISKVNSTVADVHTFLLSCQNYNVLVSQTTPMRSPAAEASTRSSKPRISGANTRKSNPPPPLDEGAAPSTPVQVNKRPLYKSSKICARVYFLYFSFLLLTHLTFTLVQESGRRESIKTPGPMDRSTIVSPVPANKADSPSRRRAKESDGLDYKPWSDTEVPVIADMHVTTPHPAPPNSHPQRPPSPNPAGRAFYSLRLKFTLSLHFSSLTHSPLLSSRSLRLPHTKVDSTVTESLQ